jgi:hypothetical protein
MKRSLWLTLSILALAPALHAQSFTATLLGSVADGQGAALPGVSVLAVQDGTGRSHSATTAGDGSYTLPGLTPGAYTLTAELQGFRRFVRRGLVLETDQVRRVDVRLQVGTFSEEVEVIAAAPVIHSETSSKGEVITQRQVQELPLNGRNYTDLALLVPGVYRRPAEDDQGEGLATAGTRTDASNFILDGIVNRSDRNASAGVNVSIDAIQEFNVQTSNYSAEFGRTAGAQVNVVSRSGSNQLHGTLYEYLRDAAFDANNYFAAPGDEKDLRRHQFGASIGGPIRKDKSFFFASYEGTREHRSETSLNLAPNADWLRGDFRNVRGAGADGVPGNADDTNRILNPFTRQEFATPNVIPESLFHPTSRAMLPYIPAANVAGSLDGYNARGISRSERDKLTLKLDHRFDAKNNLFLRWARETGSGFDPFPSARNFYPGFGRDTERRFDSLALSDTHVFHSRLINEARIGLYDQRSQNLGENRDKNWLVDFGIPGLSPGEELQGWPAVRIDGFSEFGDRPNDPFVYDVQNLQLYDMVTWVRGVHAWKFGLDVIRSNYVEKDVRNVRGDFRFRGRNTNPANATSTGFRSFADFLFGLPDSTQRQVGAEPADLTGWQVAGFVQDDWRVKPWLTLNLGLRYELQTPLTEATGRIANFIPELGQAVLSGDPRYPESLVETDRDNWGPRVGFAARPFGDERTVVRGGAGIYFSLETFNPIRQQLAVTYPFLVREQYSRLATNPALLTFSNPFPDGRGGIQGLDTPFGMDSVYRTPEFYQYNLTVERELLQDLALELGYVGSRGRHLGRRYNLNQPRPVAATPAGGVVTTRPYPTFGDIQYQDQGAQSSYDAFQTSLRRRARGGLTLLVSYTFSRAIDDASSTNNSTTGTQKFPQDVDNFAAEKSLADFHRAHQFSASVNYDLPFGQGRRHGSGWTGFRQAALGGWQVNGIVTILSGRPYTPQYSAPEVAQQRPDLVGDPASNVPPGLSFNPAAFQQPRATTADPNLFGNAGRNILIGPSFRNVDLSLFKTFKLRKDLRLQVRAEAFNALNHPNFQVPVFLLDRSNVGQLTSTANENREFQFALKLLF